MKKIYSILAITMLTVTLYAQSPNKMTYQAVIRNSSGQLVNEQQVGMQISILQGSASGISVYSEIQTPTTNANGLISVEIGTGITSDDFSTIDWSAGLYFIKTETDPTGGTNYNISGTSQLLSVPYALHANTVETINELDPVFTNWDKNYNDLINIPEQWDSTWASIKDKPEQWDSTWLSIKGKPSGNNIGDMLYWDGSKWITVPNGTPGQYLQLSGGGPTLATVHTDSVYEIGSSSFSCAGSITSDGGYDISEKGFCWSTSPNPTILDNRVTAGSGTLPYNKTLNGFNQSTTYYVRAYTKNDNTSYGEEISVTTDTASVSIGDTCFGGIVVYIYQPGDYGHVYGETHGFIISESNISDSVQWNDGLNMLTNASFVDIGYAKENTDSITAYQGNGSYAAKICSDLILNSYNDWHLPTLNEFWKVYYNRNLIGFTDTGSYWSSTEGDLNSSRYFIFTSSGAGTGTDNKGEYKAVKAIRYF